MTHGESQARRCDRWLSLAVPKRCRSFSTPGSRSALVAPVRRPAPRTGLGSSGTPPEIKFILATDQHVFAAATAVMPRCGNRGGENMRRLPANVGQDSAPDRIFLKRRTGAESCPTFSSQRTAPRRRPAWCAASDRPSAPAWPPGCRGSCLDRVSASCAPASVWPGRWSADTGRPPRRGPNASARYRSSCCRNPRPCPPTPAWDGPIYGQNSQGRGPRSGVEI